jgi:hypothetical protein
MHTLNKTSISCAEGNLYTCGIITPWHAAQEKKGEQGAALEVSLE